MPSLINIRANRDYLSDRTLSGHVDIGALANLHGKRLACVPETCCEEVLATAARWATDRLAAPKSAR